MGWLKKAVIGTIGSLAAAATITLTGAYVSLNCNGSEEEIPDAPAPIESVDFDFSGTDPDEPDVFRPSKVDSIDDWAAVCERRGLFKGDGCNTWAKVYFPNKVSVEEVKAYFGAGLKSPVDIIKMDKAGVDPRVAADFRRVGISDIEWMGKMLSACYRGSCKVASSGEVTGEEPEGDEDDVDSPGRGAPEFSVRCRNSGIDDVDVCVEYALADSSPAHAASCREEGIDDPLICLRMRQKRIPATRMKQFLAVWDLDVERPDCELEVREGEDAAKVRREHNMYALFRYAASKVNIPERLLADIRFGSQDTAVPAAKAYAYHLACIPPDDGIGLHVYGIPADYAADMFTKGRAVSGSSVTSAWYGCISLDDVLVELAAEDAVRRAHAKNPDDYERAYLRNALQRLSEKTDGHLVRHLFQYVGDVECEGAGFCDRRGCDMIGEAIELGLTREESEQLYAEGTKTLREMIDYKRQQSPVEGTGGFVSDNPFGPPPGEGTALKTNPFE